MRHLRLASPAWWTWAALASLLLAAMAGYDGLRVLALIVAYYQAIIYLGRYQSFTHFPTQVRVAYLLWMIASFIPGFAPMFWIQAVGTSVLVLGGYCPLARMLLFLPFNRTQPLTASRMLRIVLHPPTSGSVQKELAL